MNTSKPPRYKTLHRRPSLDLWDISCSNCGETIPAADINTTAGKAVCYSCNTVEILDAEEEVSSKHTNPIIYLPKGVDVIDSDGELDIRFSHFMSSSKGKLAAITFFALFWNAIILFMAYQAVQGGTSEALLFMSLHILAGLGMLGYMATQYLNYTDVVVRDGVIEVSTGPISNPFAKPNVIQADEIKQLYVQRRKTSMTNGSPNYTFDLHAVLYNRSTVKLMSNSNRDLIIYLERTIEDHLGIKNRPVSGEIQ